MQLSFLKERVVYLRQHRFVRDVAFLQAANALGTFTQALIGIFIARILQPELYGVYAVVFSLAALVYISTGVQETITVVLGETYARQDREHTISALAFFLKFTILFSIITFVVSLFLPKVSSIFYHDSRIGYYALIVITASIISSFAFSMSSMILQVSGNIKKMSGLIFSDQALRFILSLLFVYRGYGILGAVLGQFIGALAMLIVSVGVWHVIVRQHTIFPSWRELWAKLKVHERSRYLSLSVWVAVDKNIGSLYGILPVLMAGVYLSRSEVTFFKLAFGFIMLALSLLGPISVLLNSELSKMKISEQGRLRANFIRVSLYSMIISTILTAVAVVVAPFAFRVLYGSNFLPSVKYIFGLIVFGALFGIGVALGPMWRVVNRVKTSIFINCVVLGVGIPAGLYLIKNFGVWGAVFTVTLWYTVSHFASFFFLLSYID